MQTLVKHDINIAFNAHIDLITRLVLDGLEVAKYRQSKNGGGIRRDDSIYYRMMRQTGHTAAIKRMLSQEWQESHNITTFGLFYTQREADNNIKDSNISPIRNYTYINSKNFRDKVVGTKIEVMIVVDTLHDGHRVNKAWDFIGENISCLPDLRLVVFIG